MKKAFALLLALCLSLSLCFAMAEETPAAVEEQPVLTAQETVAAAYALAEGETMPNVTLTGKIAAILTPYSEETGSVTLSLQVDELADQLILCSGLTGEGAARLKEGDVITVQGTIKAENGAVGFAEGCVLSAVEEAAEAVEETVEAIEEAAAETEEAIEEAVEEAAEELEPPQSAESLVLDFLSGLGIDTTGYEEKISSALDDAKSALTDLQSSAGDWLSDAREGLSGLLDNAGEGWNTFLHELNESVEQARTSAEPEIQELRATLEKLLQQATEKDPQSEETQKLRELLEAAKTLVEDDAEAVKAFFAQVVDILTGGKE